MARSLKPSKSGLAIIDKARRSKGWNKADETWLEKAQVSVSALRRFWQGQPILQEAFIAICQAVGCNWEEIVAADSPETEVDIPDWQQASQRMLENRKWLTTNQLTARDGIRFDVDSDRIFVPMELVKRSQQRKFDKHFRPEPQNGSELYQPERERVKHDNFFQLFQDVNPEQREQPQRIALVGYPGDGKTTWLQKIAFWVLDNTDNLLIWISLGDLQGQTLEEYLLENWLKAAYKDIVDEKIKKNFVQQFNKSRVWLLLDGVDEIAMSPVDALATIARQLTGWIGEAAVALTCRINVWDDSKNALEDFDVYQVLGFETKGVNKLIDKWFQNSTDIGEQLREKLNESPDNQDKLNPKWQRLKDMIKNPLRLTLLCYICNRSGSLPNLDAEFYKQFIETFYQWKKEKFPEFQKQRQELEGALKTLALEGIKQNQFLLPYSLVQNTLKDKSLFELSLQLGLLNQVGVIKGSLSENVYAFWHPAFQEYFAALAVVDLNENNDVEYFFDVQPGTFAPQWSEVFLLWKDLKKLPIEDIDFFIYELINLVTITLPNENRQTVAESFLEKMFYAFEEPQLQAVAIILKEKIQRKKIKLDSKMVNIIVNIIKKIFEKTDKFYTHLLVLITLEELSIYDENARETLRVFLKSNDDFQLLIKKSIKELEAKTKELNQFIKVIEN